MEESPPPPPPPFVNKKSSMTSIEDLSLEVIHEILCKQPLDLKFIIRLKLVSKAFLKIVEDPSLAEKLRTQEPCILILVYDAVTNSTTFYDVRDEHNVKPICDASIHPRGFAVDVNSCNGLVCFYDHGSLEYGVLIINPMTREQIALPRVPGISSGIYALGCSGSTKECKVLQVCNVAISIQPKLYTIGTSASSWRDVSSFPPHVFCRKTVFANGALHWKFNFEPFYGGDDDFDELILSFDVDKEEFYITEHPKDLGLVDKHRFIDLIRLGESLAFADLSLTAHIDIWVLHDTVGKQWVKECVIRFDIPKHPKRKASSDDRPTMHDFDIIGTWQQGEILIAQCMPEDRTSRYNWYWDNHCFYSYDGNIENLRKVNNMVQLSPSATITRVCGSSRSLLSLKPYGGTNLR